MSGLRARWRGALAFAVILAALTEVTSGAPAWRDTEALLGWWLLAGVAWWIALEEARRGALSLAHVVLGAVVLRLVGLAAFSDLSDDIYRYVWEGARVLEGTSPYAFAPAAPQLEAARNASPELYAALNFPEVSAAYPPLTQFFCASVVALARALGLDAVWTMRAAFAACDLAVLAPLATLAARAGLPRGVVVAWGWSPLVVLEFAGTGHFDSLGILLLITALASLTPATRGAREAWGLAALAGAVVVKYLPIAALPFLARDARPAQRVGWVLGLAALSFVPFLFMEGGFSGLGAGLGEYGLRWESGSLVQRHLEPLVELAFERDGGSLDSRRVTRILLGLAWLAVGVRAWRLRLDAVRATGWLVCAFLVLSPTLHPWYVAWCVPFLALHRSFAWTWLAFAIPTAYLPLARWKEEGVWESSDLAAVFVALPFFMGLGLAAWRSARRASA